MPSMRTTLGRSRDGMIARGSDAVRRARESGAVLLERAEKRAVAIRQRLAARRSGLNGRVVDRVERRVLLGLEALFERMGTGLRAPMRWLAAKAGEAASVRPPESPPRTERVRGAVRDASIARAPANGRAAPKKRAKAKARPSARSTRWVSPRPDEIDQIAKLPVKALVARLGALTEAELRALLEHEKATKNRKSVVAAISASLPS